MSSSVARLPLRDVLPIEGEDVEVRTLGLREALIGLDADRSVSIMSSLDILTS